MKGTKFLIAQVGEVQAEAVRKGKTSMDARLLVALRRTEPTAKSYEPMGISKFLRRLVSLRFLPKTLAFGA